MSIEREAFHMTTKLVGTVGRCATQTQVEKADAPYCMQHRRNMPPLTYGETHPSGLGYRDRLQLVEQNTFEYNR